MEPAVSAGAAAAAAAAAGSPPKPPRSAGRGALESQLLASLECPVCMEYMAPPIPLCENGHSVCCECGQRMRDCPSCRRPLLRTRNLALESLARSLRYPCRHSSGGCLARLEADDVLRHSRLCPYRPLACALQWGRMEGAAPQGEKRCTWRGTVAELQAHLEAHHKRRFSVFCSDPNARAVAWELSQAGCFRAYSHVVFAFGEAFVYRKRFDMQERRLLVAVARVAGNGGGGGAVAETGFRYKFKAERANGARLSLSAAVHTVDDDLASLECAGAAVSVPFEALVAFGSGATRIVSIRRNKPPRSTMSAPPAADPDEKEGDGDRIPDLPMRPRPATSL